MVIILIGCQFVAGSSFLSSQTIDIKGRVTEAATCLPIAFASVHIRGGTTGTTT